MKKIIYLFVFINILNSCKAQSVTPFNSENKDILIFSLLNIDSIKNPNQIYSLNNFLIMQRIRSAYNYNKLYHQVDFQFNNKKDTMKIKCFCPQNNNYYFKNLEFKKGNFELRFDFPKKINEKTKVYEPQIKYTLGNQIKTPKKVQNILFKDVYISVENSNKKNKYFKDLKFIEIDLKDTINVKLRKME